MVTKPESTRTERLDQHAAEQVAKLLPTIEEYVRWHRLHEAYKAGHPDPDGKVLLCLADGCGKAGQRLLDAAAELDATEPAGCSSRKTED